MSRIQIWTHGFLLLLLRFEVCISSLCKGYAGDRRTPRGSIARAMGSLIDEQVREWKWSGDTLQASRQGLGSQAELQGHPERTPILAFLARLPSFHTSDPSRENLHTQVALKKLS